MIVERLKENIRPPIFEYVTVKEMGNITELRYMVHSMGGIVKKLDKNRYMNLLTGEIKEYQHNTKRVDDKKGISQSLKKLRDIINTNVTNVKNCLWVTLTYKENMTDHKRLYEDYRKFNMRFQRYLQKNNLPNCEYIATAEPQGRGAWHLHIIYIFPSKAPFIENSILADLWGFGFVNIKSLKNVDNVRCLFKCLLSQY